MTPDRPLRADARRNLERIMASAQALFAEHGPAAQMEDVAARAGVGIGTLYRRFPTKEALITALVRERFRSFAVIAAEAEALTDPYLALETVMRGHAESVVHDTAFQLAMMTLDSFHWDGIEEDKRAVGAIVTRIIERAQVAGSIRDDLRFEDYIVLMRGITATMYFGEDDAGWARHLELTLEGLGAC